MSRFNLHPELGLFYNRRMLSDQPVTVTIKLPLLLIFLLLSATACGSGSSGSGSTSKQTPTAITVGKKIFFDESLSSEGNQSCASCHDPDHGFADPDVSQTAPVSEGSVSGVFGNRNAPTTAYASFIPNFGKSTTATVETASEYQGGQFLDGRQPNLVAQAKDPFLNSREMNNTDAATVVSKVQNSSYSDEFKSVFGTDSFSNPVTAYNNIATAISAFEASTEMNPFSSKFDAVMAGTAQFTDSEARGFELFKGSTAKCANCHLAEGVSGNPALFTDFKYFNVGTPANSNNPIYQLDSGFIDRGLANNPSIDAGDINNETGKFRTPTLRNVELTAPYMHNGVYATLEDVIRHYDIQVTNEFITPEVNENIASELNPGLFISLGLTPQDYTDLENFMLTLTDGYQ